MILLILAILLSYILLPIGFIYSFFKLLFKRKLRIYFVMIAVSLDQLANKVCGEMFNDALINKEGYRFGHVDETISSALGRNVLTDTLTPLGRRLVKLLDSISKDHCVRSIEHNLYINEK